MTTEKPYEFITDFVTGEEIPNIGAEENRQQVERFLVESKGYEKTAIEVDPPLEFSIGDELYASNVDLVVRVQEKRIMVFRCVPGSLGSRHRETLAAARLLETYQIPFSIVSDGTHAEVLDTITGAMVGEGLEAIPSRKEVVRQMKDLKFEPYPEKKIARERIIYRSYDEMNVNVRRKLNT